MVPSKQDEVGTRSTPISPTTLRPRPPRFVHRVSCDLPPTPLGSSLPPRVIHLNFKEDESPTSLPATLFLEDNKEATKSTQGELEQVSGKSTTTSETPHGNTGSETTKSLCSGPHGKEESEFRHYVCGAHQSPSMLTVSETDLSKLVTGATSLGFSKIAPSRSPAATQAYMEFLYYLFESVCLIKQIAPAIAHLPPPQSLALPRLGPGIISWDTKNV